ncbi:MAG: hypothetical protein WCG60_02630 [bacterium]|jgi:hypothetical protein
MTNKDIKLNTDNSQKLADDIISNLGQISEKERGEVITSIAITYIKMMNELNQQHIDMLKKTLSLLSSIKNEEVEVSDKIKINKIRSELNK